MNAGVHARGGEESLQLRGIGAGELPGPFGHGRAQSLRSVAAQDPAPVHDGDPVASLCLVHVRCPRHQGEPAAEQVVENLPELSARDGVDPGGRLVEQQQLGLVNERAAQMQLLLHAARELRRATFAEGREAAPRQKLRLARLARTGRHAVEVGEEVQVLGDREGSVESEALRDVADARAQTLRFPGHVAPEHRGAAARGFQQRGQDLQQGRLAGAVGADEAEHLAWTYLEVDAVDGDELPEASGELTGLDDRRHAMSLQPVSPGRFGIPADARIHRHARFEDALWVVQRKLDGEDEPRPLVLHVDVARRELRLL